MSRSGSTCTGRALGLILVVSVAAGAARAGADEPQAPQPQPPPQAQPLPQPPPQPQPQPLPSPQAQPQPQPLPLPQPLPPPSIRGTVRASDGKTPIAGALVVIPNTTFGAVSDAAGAYEIDDVPPGAYELHISTSGYDDAVVPVTVSAGALLAVSTALQKTITGQEIVVTGSKFPEKRVEAPVTLERVTAEDVKLVGASNYMTALSQVKGIQYRESGLGDIRLSMRGFDSQFNPRMVWMVDGKLAELPGTGVPMGGQLPTPSLDIKSVEVVVGPASALYGANAVDGVVNVITKTPWDQSGVDVAMRVGNQDLADVSLRVAGKVRHRFGYKLNAQWMQAQDFAPDRNLPFHYYGSAMAPGGAIFEGDLVANAYRIRTGKLEGFLYARLGAEWNLKAGTGFSYFDGMSTTNIGRNELRGWLIDYQTLQLSHPHWFAQVTRTADDAGQSYAVNTLASVVQAAGGLSMVNQQALEAMRQKIAYRDSSQMVDSELQYRDEFWRRLRLTVGAQFRAYLPSSDGTLFDDANGKKIHVFLGGEYAQADWIALRDRLRVNAAVRVDEHSDYGVTASPKAAVVLTLAHDHHLRVGYNRAFKAPTILDAYIDVAAAGAYGNHSGFVVTDGNGTVVSKIPALVPEENNTLEAGYKGDLGRRLFIDAVAFYSFYAHFISPLTLVALPSKGTFASFPDGTPTFAGTPQQGTLITYSNFGAAEVVGANLGLDAWLVRDRLVLTAAASYIHLVSFTTGNPSQKGLPLNVPEWTARASLTLTDLPLRNSFVRLQGRYAESYVFQSGVWDSTVFYANGKVPARFVADLVLGYHFTDGITVSANIFDLTNDHGIDVLGAPPGGIVAYAQLAYTWSGLDY